MLPKEITCHLNEDCPIMLPVNGNPLNKYGKQSLYVENLKLNYICVDKSTSLFLILCKYFDTELHYYSDTWIKEPNQGISS